MDKLDFLIKFHFAVFPEFYTIKDFENNEYVFLKTEDNEIKILQSVTDKTQLEAYENHIHLFGKVKKRYQKDSLKVAQLITENLVKQLGLRFPDKKFKVYLDCDFEEHIIIRFHQVWKNELPYYNVNDFSTITEYTVDM